MSLEATLSQVDANLPQSLDRLFDLLRIPSISTDPEYKAECDRAADWMVDELTALGFAAQKHPTSGHPMVTGSAGDGGPHLMFYGHYDVQPIDPINLWSAPPFEPELQDTPNGKVIRARGANDDKGQLMTFIEALRAWIAVNGALPGRISVFFEGEEECGSPSLLPFLEAHKETLSQADLVLICDTGMFDRQTPSITTSLRGLLGEELTITGPDRDLHSGMFGGIAINPARVLARVIAALHDDQGRVTVPEFYDGVPELSDAQRVQWDGLGFDEPAFLAEVGLSRPAGETGRSGLEMIWSRPTCEVNGMWSGYTGAGFKTVLPSTASAKISFRLVGDQDPAAIRKNFRAMVRAMLPSDCTVDFVDHGAAGGTIMPTDNPIFEAARLALSDEWPQAAAFTGSGGSIPIAGYFKDILGLDSMLIGFGRDDDGLHSPNEKYDLESFHKGIRSWARVLDTVYS